MREAVVVFGQTDSLVGIITDPPAERSNAHLPALVLLNAGAVHRVGPHRLYVKLARNLASLGFVVLRFDASGIGDSAVRNDNLPFEKSAVSETQEAMHYLSTVRGMKRFVLIGLCSGAAISFNVALGDPRVVGAVLINVLLTPFHQISDAMIAYITRRTLARSYWKIKIFNPQSWLRVFKGKAHYRRILKVIGDLLGRPFTRRTPLSTGANHEAEQLRGLSERGVRLLLIYNEGADILDYLYVTLGDIIRELSASGKLHVEIVPQATHTFMLLRHQEHLLNLVCNWARAISTL